MGLPMGTRCGSLDPGVILFLMQNKSRDEIEDLLYKKSGLLGISGISNDVASCWPAPTAWPPKRSTFSSTMRSARSAR
jgi:acetate kinase